MASCISARTGVAFVRYWAVFSTAGLAKRLVRRAVLADPATSRRRSTCQSEESPEPKVAKRFTVRAASALRALALFAVSLLILSAQAASATAPSDDFNRPNGSLGSNWVAMSDGALSIASQAVVGTSATAGDIRIAETYGSDQSSQIELTSTQLSGGAVGRAGRPHAERRPGHLPRDLLLEQRQPATPPLQAERRHLDSARQLLQLRAAAGRHDAAAERRRHEDLLPAGRRYAGRRHRHQHQRRRARDHDLRPGQGRQLGGRRRDRQTRARPTRSAAASPGSPGRSCSATTAATT